MRIIEIVKVIIFIVSLLLLNRVVFKPLVKQILDEQIRAAAMVSVIKREREIVNVKECVFKDLS